MRDATTGAGAETRATRPLVFDAGAIIALFRDEAGADVVEDLCLNNPGRLYIHALNACEVLYDSRRSHGETGIAESLDAMRAIGLEIREDMDAAIRDDAAVLKADYHRVSLADCFMLALARRLGGEAISTDHHELDPLVPLNLCPIRFIR